MVKQFKPMKGIDIQKVKDPLTFPKIASVKLDGIRCIIKDGKLLSSHLKEFRNPSLNKKFAHLLEINKTEGWIFDGELYSHELEFNVISGNVRSLKQEIHESIEFHAFDILTQTGEILSEEDEYTTRVRTLYDFILEVSPKYFKFVNTVVVNSKKDMDDFFEVQISRGYEGAIFRDPISKYKFGRATPKSQDLIKYKPFETFDAKIIGITQQYISTAEAEYNELGKSFRSHKKDDMVPIERAASFEVVMEDGTKLSVSIGQEESHRDEIWKNQENFIGQWIEFKAMQVGSKDRPRHPNFIRYRDPKD